MKQRSFAFRDNTVHVSVRQVYDHELLGGTVWKGAILLAEWIAAHPELFEQKSVIEMGAGCGLCGVVCAKLCNAKSVVLTDLEEVLPLLQSNIDLLGPKNQRACADITTMAYRFGDTQSLRPPYDVFLMSEVLYIEEEMQSLVHSLLYLTKPGSILLVCNERRAHRAPDIFYELTQKYFNPPVRLSEEEVNRLVPSWGRLKCYYEGLTFLTRNTFVDYRVTFCQEHIPR